MCAGWGANPSTKPVFNFLSKLLTIVVTEGGGVCVFLKPPRKGLFEEVWVMGGLRGYF